MPVYKAPTRDARFLINEVLRLQDHAALPGFASATPDMVDAVVEEAGKFCSEVLAPINLAGDQEGCTRHPDGTVTVPSVYKDAFAQFRAAGWSTLSVPEEFGGQGLPHVLGMLMEEFMSSANQAFGMYPGLTAGAISAILAKGSPEQKAKYVPKMVACEWLGTMNLTEPQCGTDLGLIRTRAVAQADGSYAITGTKIFISSGEHDLTENIIHLVLAKTPDAPDSTKGISLFIVPKVLVNDDGSLGARNAVSCGSIEHKMGIHGNATCVMNYDGATGYLVGEENKGLAAMFIMMNAARLGVGIQGLAQAEVAYQNAVKYAGERRQGRALTGAAEPAEKADTLFVHPDVRRMLMDAKAFTEAMRALCMWGALQVDLSHKAASEEERQKADDLISLLTPVIKGYGTDKGYDVATNMQQVFGGHGYIEEWGMSQFVRDARIAMIYEGTNGIQAMDLVGRKLAQNGGRAVQTFFAIVDAECAAAKAKPELAGLAAAVEAANADLKAATMWLMANGMANPNQVGAGAHHYMHIMGIVALGSMWLRMGEVALEALAKGEGDKAFYEAKLTTARYFGERFCPDSAALRRKIEAGCEAVMALPVEAFATA
ncbi:acyl-CoA dehydrogenase C-terminal domain-containing protein [Novosphingobium sp.]|uniref:acyl-CoA dehydrogenase C-terminal domain-containing protein n=1 Tax=Novosphingobium sp. TaxID=1874826 RepID=UPI0022C66F91|nr:acyl-CoA dehydrogenase C-terminal domain-containing protein [Novosphingobium sp.]MCZ8017286.1 acyl-CoA dehydrogenase C-terminal domain-containing protein [Novosphingobium sp.]MCZ8034191.1 acyl-CoA dehydrogenase C-terminal domain-containing protein [Novosphingobium sp.]MCZ8051546.1 acyl-CoA dehydrogenase C-terminal domain-containing protein [Novosphingobium sp.]MCZ8059892.1 acyl-CoA dehydrogenase C-terminal domain-containing protein [Novosphingobium sp.]MCZ8231730.1 acyl-CoA dehydrogenase C-